MVKLKIARVAAAAAASAGLIASFSGVAGATSYNGDYNDGGGCGCYSQDYNHHKHNKPKTIITTDTQTDQENNVTVDNQTDQNAYTGNVTVNGGNKGGNPWGDSWGNKNKNNNQNVNATSGDAMNSNSFNATVNANNTAPDMNAPYVPSGNKGGTTIVKTDTTTEQENNVTVDNSTTQNAYTGNITVNGGSGKGGTVNATSGDASNYNSTSVTVNASNK